MLKDCIRCAMGAVARDPGSCGTSGAEHCLVVQFRVPLPTNIMTTAIGL